MATKKHSKLMDRVAFNCFSAGMGLFIRNGQVTLSCDGLPEKRFGTPDKPRCTMQMQSPRALWRVLKESDLGLGEGYMDQEWELTEGDLGKFIGILLENQMTMSQSAPYKLASTLFGWTQTHANNNEDESRKNVQHHYDIGNDLYETFLDEGMNYSCAFFDAPGMSLREAQLNKIRTSIERLDIQPGMNILDLGCGWGEMSCTIAAETKAAHVTGITLADNQIKIAKERVPAKLKNKLGYEIIDYRDHTKANESAYDRIISIGMFEHVGMRNYQSYFDCIETMLKPGGKALIHSILRSIDGEPTSPWFDKYIFPGGCIPALEDMLEAADKAGLKPANEPYIHAPSNYAETLRQWRKNFNEIWPRLDHKLYDERFKRMWNFYLAGAEASFDGLGYTVGQIVFEKKT